MTASDGSTTSPCSPTSRSSFRGRGPGRSTVSTGCPPVSAGAPEHRRLSGPWLWLPLVGPIRISTAFAAVAIFTVILWRQRSPLLALVTVLAWASVFEIAYNATGTLLHGWPLAYLVWLAAALGGWVLLAWRLGVVPSRVWLA